MSRNAKKEDEKNDVNKHLPRYIQAKPWYYDSSKNEDALAHHRQSNKGNNLLDIENNNEPKIGLGIKDSFVQVNKGETLHRHRKPTCTNCGGYDHKKRDCLERPRKQNKKANTKDPAQSYVLDEGSLDWDARKDRWFGYSGKEYQDTLKQWEKKKRDAKISGVDANEKDYDTDEEIELQLLGLTEKKGNDTATSKGEFTSVRLREDKAAYLNDINSDKINYDPKSRLYKSDSLGTVDEESNMFRRKLTGEGAEFANLNKIARQNAKDEGIRDEVKDEKKVEHILVANPTKYDQMMKQMKSGKTDNNTPTNDEKSRSLEARKIQGTKQSKKSKRNLNSMYK